MNSHFLSTGGVLAPEAMSVATTSSSGEIIEYSIQESIVESGEKMKNFELGTRANMSKLEDWWRMHRVGIGSEQKIDSQFKKICKDNYDNMDQFYEMLVLCKSSKHYGCLFEK